MFRLYRNTFNKALPIFHNLTNLSKKPTLSVSCLLNRHYEREFILTFYFDVTEKTPKMTVQVPKVKATQLQPGIHRTVISWKDEKCETYTARQRMYSVLATSLKILISQAKVWQIRQLRSCCIRDFRFFFLSFFCENRLLRNRLWRFVEQHQPLSSNTADTT